MPERTPDRSTSATLLRWYDRHRRALPWRESARAADPYAVWVAEIMLQQTRAAAAAPYYERFLARFPTLPRLAAARPATVLAAWSGLGYYRRARFLHAAARLIRRVHGGRFPADWAAVRALPGVGDYTAAAVLSIAFQQPYVAVDGNLERIAARLAGAPLRRAAAAAALGAWMPRRRPGDFNQALMDLGATVCLPRAPLCPACPLRGACRTQGEMLRAPTPPRTLLRETYALHRQAERVWLVRRPPSAALLPGMYELPAAAAAKAAPTLAELRHAITRYDIRARVVAGRGAPPGRGRWVGPRQAAALPLTGMARKALRQCLGWPFPLG